jgi:hypothetical protein
MADSDFSRRAYNQYTEVSMPRALWLAMLLCLGCAESRLTTAPAPAEIDAMLLPPVDGQLALWVNQPTNFAVIGTTQEHGADVLYQQTALQSVPMSGYVYVPQGDAGYDRVYLVASHDPIDLTGSLDDAIAGANVVDAYAADTVGLDSLRCNDGRLSLVRTMIVSKNPKRTREDDERFANCYLEHHFERQRYALAAGRQFFAIQPGKPLTTHKFLPPGYKPPKLVPKPGTQLGRSDQRALRWYAAKDQWHAITHNGEPGTELPRALGYVRYGSVWVPRWGNAMLGGAHEEVRAIVNGNVGSVHGTTALVMEPTGRIATAEVSVSRGFSSQGAPRVEYSTGGGAGYTSSYHEAATRASYSAPSYSAPSSGASSHESSSTSSAGSSSSGGHH